MFERLVERYWKRVCAYAYAMLGTRDDAEDAAQETFLRALQAHARFDQRRRFGPWIHRIARNVCIDRLRRGRRHESTFGQNDVESADETPAELYERMDARAQVRKAVASLPKRYRRVLLLRYGRGMSYSEIASVLRISEEGVGTRLVRAKRAMRDAITKCLW